MNIPIRYNLLSLARRRMSTTMTALGIALVVAVFVITMSLGEGIRKSLGATGRPLNLVVLRQGSSAETTSFVTRNAFFDMKYLDGIVRIDRSLACARTGLEESRFADQLVPLAAPETLLLIRIRRKGAEAGSNVVIRGGSAVSFLVHPEVKITAGRTYRPGLREIIVSRQIADRYENCGIGARLKFGRDYWTVVGHFSAGNSAFNSEIWGDALELGADFDRNQFSSVTIAASDEQAAKRLIKRIGEDPRLNLHAMPEIDYYKQQMVSAMPIEILGTFLATVMAIGACFAAMNTMYASVTARVREIGTLRVLGFQPKDILRSFVLESALMALIGGLAGCALTLPVDGVATGTANWQTFGELAFRFTITPKLIAQGLLFSLFMGLLGGFPPARSAARKSIISTIKEL
ncbi:MAG: ABC transporter permease [Candidatus Sumerlaeota bacterium]|nr:ABC transporter permease [Candidatus Sumerlaeota bacterium]